MSDRRPVYGLLIFFGLIVLCFAFGMMMLRGTSGSFGEHDGPRVGVVEVTGMITDAKRAIVQLRDFARDESVRAIIVRIDSPGGAVGPSQEIYREVQRTRKKKPVVASLGAVAASGGYYIAAACEKVVASAGTLTGSIGVITQTSDVSELMRLARLDITVFKSGKFKDTGSPIRPLSEADRQLLQEIVDGIHAQFVEDVSKGRGMPAGALKEIADGRVLTGASALKLELVDKLGNLSDALDVAAELAGAKGEPRAVYPRPQGGLLRQLLDEDAVRSMVQSLSAMLRPALRIQLRDPLLD
jgi:protease-4